MSPIVKMEILSREYGWTPTQIRELTNTDVESYLQIIRDRRKIEERESKKHKK